MAIIQKQSAVDRLFSWFSRLIEEASYVFGQQDRPSHLSGHKTGIESANSHKSSSTSTMWSRLQEVRHTGKKANRPKSPYHSGRSTPILITSRSADQSSWTKNLFSSGCFSVFFAAKKQPAQVHNRPYTPPTPSK
jgi:hypothetical protein